MKLKTLLRRKLNEIELERNTWTNVSDLDQYKKTIFNLIQNAYKGIGGHHKIKSPSDVKDRDKGRVQFFQVIDLDDDPEPDAVIVGKETSAGKKDSGMGHDGTKIAKRTVVAKQIKDLKTSGHYVEASGRIGEILTSAGVPIIDDEATVRKVLKGKELEWLGDNGKYKRTISGHESIKQLFGKPKT